MSIPFTDISALFIDGRWVDAGAERDAVVNPATEAIIGMAPVGGADSAEAAIAAARRAFDSGPWPEYSPEQRAVIMRRMHAALVARKAQIRELIIAEVGCAQLVTDLVQIGAPLEHFERTIADSLRPDTHYLPVEATPNPVDPSAPHRLGGGETVREPIGVVAGITGYNFPFLLNLAKIVPALLAGNTMVLKPSPFTPYSALLFGEVALEIGLPLGVLNIITGGPDIGTLLSTDPRVDMVSFTGSEGVGAAIMVQAAPSLKRVHLELGGKSALIVRHDADIAKVVPEALFSFTANAGQGCALLTRLLVHNSIRAPFVAAMKAVASQWVIGDPTRAEVLMGPLIRESQRAKVEHFVRVGQEEGARLVHGGGRPAQATTGFFTDVTIFDDVTSSMTIAQEEIFGPVAAVIGFDSDAEAIAIANDSRFGLHGGIATQDAATGYRMARKIRTGSVAINGGMGKMPYASIGGYKRSGLGREYGKDWLREFTLEKSLFYPIGH